ncbi:MAG: hypothetical protein IJY42_04170 [Clostridia bacterium]|nr:hypothetical protein [Clostridia bacterium]
MNPTYYILILILLLVMFFILQSQKQMMIKQLRKKRNSEDRIKMKELAKRFVDKECLIYTFNGNQINGTIKEVSDGALLVESNGTVEAINMDFVMRIREYPKKKNGKKKSVVLD